MQTLKNDNCIITGKQKNANAGVWNINRKCLRFASHELIKGWTSHELIKGSSI